MITQIIVLLLMSPVLSSEEKTFTEKRLLFMSSCILYLKTVASWKRGAPFVGKHLNRAICSGAESLCIHGSGVMINFVQRERRFPQG